jgi:hypothetical protein
MPPEGLVGTEHYAVLRAVGCNANYFPDIGRPRTRDGAIGTDRETPLPPGGRDRETVYERAVVVRPMTGRYVGTEAKPCWDGSPGWSGHRSNDAGDPNRFAVTCGFRLEAICQGSTAASSLRRHFRSSRVTIEKIMVNRGLGLGVRISNRNSMTPGPELVKGSGTSDCVANL